MLHLHFAFVHVDAFDAGHFPFSGSEPDRGRRVERREEGDMVEAVVRYNVKIPFRAPADQGFDVVFLRHMI